MTTAAGPGNEVGSFHSGVLLGEQTASKTVARGSNPRTVAVELKLLKCRRGSKQKGAGPVNRIMRVRIPPSALPSRWCNGTHRTLLRSESWFDSRSGYSMNCPRSVVDSHATLRRSRTRFDSWRGHSSFGAGARRQGGCLQSSNKWVRLPPASLEISALKSEPFQAPHGLIHSRNFRGLTRQYS